MPAPWRYRGRDINYPPAEPEALRLPAPQRGLIATDNVKTNNCGPRIWTGASCARRNILPELSNSCCLPGRAGGSPYGLEKSFLPTIFCIGLVWFTKRQIEGTDPPHVVTADLSLLTIILLFRALKDFVSAQWPSQAQVEVAPRRKRRAVKWAVLCLFVWLFSLLWTRYWPVPDCMASPIKEEVRLRRSDDSPNVVVVSVRSQHCIKEPTSSDPGFRNSVRIVV